MSEPQLLDKSAIEAEAKAIKEKRKLPEKPGDRVSFKDFDAWQRLLTPDMCEDNRIILYIYRQEPVIIRQKVDATADNNIDVWPLSPDAMFTEPYMISHHGGGTYKIVVKDCDKPKTTKGGFFEAKLTIPINLHEPKLDYREVDWDHPHNKGFKAWARAAGKIDNNNMPVEMIRKENGNAAPNDAMVQMTKTVLEFASKMNEKDQNQLKTQLGANDLSKSIGDILLEQMKQQDPNKQLATITQLITAMQAMNKPDNTMATIMPMFLQMMTAAQERSDKMFMMFMENMKKDTPEKEERDEISKLKDLMEVAKMIKGGSGPVEDKPWYASVVEHGLPLLGQVAGMVNNMMAMKAAQNGVPIQPTGVNSAKVVNTQPVNGVGQIEEAKVVETPKMTSEQATQLMRQFGPIIMNKLGQEGWETGAWIIEGFGDPVLAQILQLGEEGLFAACKSVPEIYNQIMGTYGEAHFRKWLKSLMNTREEIKKMDEEEEEGDKE
jgi:hypothetical protein